MGFNSGFKGLIGECADSRGRQRVKNERSVLCTEVSTEG